MKALFIPALILVLLVSTLKAEEALFPIQKLEFIGETIVPNDTVISNTPVGGISGMDYYPVDERWVFISDDRSDFAPARAYLGSLPIAKDSVGPLKISDIVFFKQPDGSYYPNRKSFAENGKGIVPDLESVRFDPRNATLWYTSEGDRSLGLNPFFRSSLIDGSYIQGWSLPNYYNVNSKEDHKGFQNNLALEGSSFSPDGAFYFVAMEGPLMQDGASPTIDHGANSRILKYDRLGNIMGEYVYPVDALPAKPGVGKHGDNGISEILAIDSSHLLVLERSGIQDDLGDYHDYVRIYQVDLEGATNVKGREQLVESKFKPVVKKLLLNLNNLPIEHLDNIECMSFGSVLPDGRKTLVVASDNNFYHKEITQILAFTIYFTE